MKKTKVSNIIARLSEEYPNAKPQLIFNSDYQLLVAVILSAQCTDARVNKITEELFKEYGTPEKMITLSATALGEKIFSCGLYKSKAKHILEASKDILERFNGNVPDNLKDLITLSGVGRKTANVVYSVAFQGNAIAVDTHVFRVSNRIGLVTAKNVLLTEKGLMKILDKSDWSRAHHYLIYLGRSFCKAKKPDCENCPITDLCEKKIKR